MAATGAACFGVAAGITQTPYRNLRTFITSKWETFGAGRSDGTDGTDGTWNLYTVDLAWWNDAGPGILVEYQAQHGLGIASLSMVEMGGFVLLGTAIGVLWAGGYSPAFAGRDSGFRRSSSILYCSESRSRQPPSATHRR